MAPALTTVDLDTAELRKARGAFFTPEPVARYITESALRSAREHVLEPSCGDAAFLLAAVDRLAALGSQGGSDESVGALDGVELHEASAAAAQRLLDEAGVKAHIQAADLFTVEPTGSHDAVIGNPPYVRYERTSSTLITERRTAMSRSRKEQKVAKRMIAESSQPAAAAEIYAEQAKGAKPGSLRAHAAAAVAIATQA